MDRVEVMARSCDAAILGSMEQIAGSQMVAIRKSISDSNPDLLRTVLGATNYGFMLTDLDHVTIARNARFGELFGVDISWTRSLQRKAISSANRPANTEKCSPGNLGGHCSRFQCWLRLNQFPLSSLKTASVP